MRNQQNGTGSENSKLDPSRAPAETTRVTPLDSQVSAEWRHQVKHGALWFDGTPTDYSSALRLARGAASHGHTVRLQCIDALTGEWLSSRAWRGVDRPLNVTDLELFR